MPDLRTILLAAFALLFAHAATAQSVRALGMGGVLAPGNAALANPAYAGLPDEGTSIPLPLGLVAILVDPDRYTPGSDDADLLSILDQATRLDAYLLNPATSPDEWIVSVEDSPDGLVIAVDAVGGSNLAIVDGRAFAAGPDLELPIAFRAGPVDVGLRPYLTSDLRWRPDADLEALFGAGTAQGAAELDLEIEAGVQIDLGYAAALPLPEGAYPGTLLVGGRVSPFLSLARLQANGTLDVAVTDDEVDARLQGDAFQTLVSDGNVGYGVRTDLGVATRVPLPDGTLTAGLSVRGLGVAVWSGEAYRVDVGSASDDGSSDPVPETRTEALLRPAVQATAAFDVDPSAVGVPEIASLLLAADAGWKRGRASAHLGLEAGFDVGFGQALARTGGGYDDGLVLGVGAGLRLGGVGIDAALHGRPVGFTRDTSYGLSAGLSFGF